jgi:nitrogen fixation NifU-like protein
MVIEEVKAMYSKTVMDHFKNPRNVGVIENPDGMGEIGNPLCGDMMTIYLQIADDTIKDIKFQTFGCGAAIAVSSMLTELAKGKTIEEAKKITNKDVAKALEGLPKNKLHCSNLGADALHQAIQNYEARKAGKLKDGLEVESDKHVHDEKCYCPYCDTQISEGETVCKDCALRVDDQKKSQEAGE